jgi:hypothetical protein
MTTSAEKPPPTRLPTPRMLVAADRLRPPWDWLPIGVGRYGDLRRMRVDMPRDATPALREWIKQMRDGAARRGSATRPGEQHKLPNPDAVRAFVASATIDAYKTAFAVGGFHLYVRTRTRAHAHTHIVLRVARACFPTLHVGFATERVRCVCVCAQGSFACRHACDRRTRGCEATRRRDRVAPNRAVGHARSVAAADRGASDTEATALGGSVDRVSD